MMKPKEQAKMLIDKHKSYIMPHHDEEEDEFEREKALNYFAKEAAVISADVALSALEDTVYGDLYEYWVEVKNEIKNYKS